MPPSDIAPPNVAPPDTDSSVIQSINIEAHGRYGIPRSSTRISCAGSLYAFGTCRGMENSPGLPVLAVLGS